MDRYGGWPRSGTADEMGVARRRPVKHFCERLAQHGADENIEFQVRFALRGEIRFNLQTLFVLELTTDRLF